jgi:hypothetical protein
MTTPHAHIVGWLIFNWLVTLHIEKVERARTVTPATDENYIDWDALSEQYGVPVSPQADGLQLCAQCGQSVAPKSKRRTGRRLLSTMTPRATERFPHPAGAYLCAACQRNSAPESTPKTQATQHPEAHSPQGDPMPNNPSTPTMKDVVYAILGQHQLVETFEAASDFHLSLENSPYLKLVIERHDAEVSLAHYFNQNGDAMRDPELTFHLPDWSPTSITQDPLGHYACVEDLPDGSRERLRLLADLTVFARTWAGNLQAQGFAKPDVVVSSLTHPAALEGDPGLPERAEDSHLEAEYESQFEYEDYEPSPYDGTYSEE